MPGTMDEEMKEHFYRPPFLPLKSGGARRRGRKRQPAARLERLLGISAPSWGQARSVQSHLTPHHIKCGNLQRRHELRHLGSDLDPCGGFRTGKPSTKFGGRTSGGLLLRSSRRAAGLWLRFNGAYSHACPSLEQRAQGR